MSFKGQLIEFFKREITFNKNESYYENGQNDDYSERIERLINNSGTAKQCASTMAVFLTGKGFGINNNLNVGNGQTLLQVTHKGANSLSRQRGVFVHVNYDLNFDVSSIDVLPFSQCKIGKKDSNKYNGKIGVSEDWKDKKSIPQWFDVYNDSEAILKIQTKILDTDSLEEKTTKLQAFKGQVLYINLDYNYLYPLSTIDAVREDCDSEFKSSQFKNNLIKRDYTGKQIFITEPMQDAKPEENAAAGDWSKYHQSVSEADNFKKVLEGFHGGGESEASSLWIQKELDDERKMQDLVHIINVNETISESLITGIETSLSASIMVAFGIPSILIKQTEGGLFSGGGEQIKQAKLVYQERTTIERMILVETLQMLVSKMAKPVVLVQELLVTEEEDIVEVGDADTKKAQATLKGSVGGVQGILGIQQSYSEGKTDRKSAITILTEIYGFTVEIADSLLGEPEEEKNI